MPDLRAGAIAWLLQGDPAVRWQCLRDLVQAPPAAVERERERVATAGWGARLLAQQDPAGTWASALYTPKWTSTFYTLLLLHQLGLGADQRDAVRGARILLDRGFCAAEGGLNYSARRAPQRTSETCITGMGLAILASFRVADDRLGAIVQHLLDRQLPDGGWNCQFPGRATHASFNTTILALEGLAAWEHLAGRSPGVAAARRRGEEFLLLHRLCRSHTTGAVARPAFTRLAFPPHWQYDVLRALDYFRAAAVARDARLAEAIALLRSRQLPSGRWPLQQRYAGAAYFDLEAVGAPSRWNTLRALRVLDWWDGG